MIITFLRGDFKKKYDFNGDKRFYLKKCLVQLFAFQFS